MLRKLLLLSLLVPLAACPGDGLGSLTFAGTYELRLVNGSPLPYDLGPGPENSGPLQLTGGHVKVQGELVEVANVYERKVWDAEGDTTVLYAADAHASLYERSGNRVYIPLATGADTITIVEEDVVRRWMNLPNDGRLELTYCTRPSC